MNHSETVYCIECNMIMERGNAEKIFKTGYFKTTIPLCLCKECACVDSKEVVNQIISSSQECYFDYALPFS